MTKNIKHIHVEDEGDHYQVVLYNDADIEIPDPLTFPTGSSLKRFMWMTKELNPKATSNWVFPS